MKPGQRTPNEFEVALLAAFARQDPSLAATLRELHVLSREFTGVGSFTTFLCDDAARWPSRSPVTLARLITIPGVAHGLCAVLFFDGSQPKMLEVAVYGEEHWDGLFDGFAIE